MIKYRAGLARRDPAWSSVSWVFEKNGETVGQNGTTLNPLFSILNFPILSQRGTKMGQNDKAAGRSCVRRYGNKPIWFSWRLRGKCVNAYLFRFLLTKTAHLSIMLVKVKSCLTASLRQSDFRIYPNYVGKNDQSHVIVLFEFDKRENH